MRRTGLGVAAATLVAMLAFRAAGSDVTSTELYRASVDDIEQGAYGAAIAKLELLADRGFVHPDASYNRAAAYAGRARSQQARPGDLGRPAAALSEALLLRPDDESAERALLAVRNEIARRRSREGAEPVFARPTIDRAIVGLASERVWAFCAASGSALLTVGLAVRWLLRRPGARLGGSVAALVGLFLLLTFGALAAMARHLRVTTHPAVIVVSEARILDEHGTPVVQRDGEPEYLAIPEGAEIEIGVRSGRLARFRWGGIEGWMMASQARVLTRP